ncbi:MAG TPA: hypothetical protein VJK02_00025 [Anaerolineales bacterium]|nr:hypothetical protein [Anaerolineales bacterium]
MDAFVSESKDRLQVKFWGAVAFVAGLALERRRILRRAISYAPFTAGAVSAYVLGCFAGAALLAYLP